MKAITRIINITIISILILLLAMNIYTLIQQVFFRNDLPKVFGYARAQMVSGSMEDAISIGDMIIIHKADTYNVGDIVTYRANSLITHRIVVKTDEGYIVKGDANNTSDGEIKPDKIEGKVVFIIPWIGFVFDFLKTSLGILIISIATIALIEAPHLKNLIKRKKHTAGSS